MSVRKIMENQELKKKKPFYKKAWFRVAAGVVVIVFASGRGSDDSSEGEKTVNEFGSKGDVSAEGADVEASDAEGAETQEAESNSGNSDVTIETQVLADSNGIKVIATGIEKGVYGPEIKLQIENTSDVPVMVQSSGNGW